MRPDSGGKYVFVGPRTAPTAWRLERGELMQEHQLLEKQIKLKRLELDTLRLKAKMAPKGKIEPED